MKNMNTTIIPVNAFSAIPVQTPDGIRWLELYAEGDIYSYFKKLPNIVRYDSRLYQKMSFNSDTNVICYKEVSEKNIALPV